MKQNDALQTFEKYGYNSVEVRKVVSKRNELRDEQWDRIKQYFEVEKKNGRIKLLLSAGNVNDITVAPELLEGLRIRDTTVMADKAYCSRKWRQSLYSLQKDI